MFKVMLVMLLGFVAVAMVFAIKEIPQRQSAVSDGNVAHSDKDAWDLETAETANKNGGQQHSHGGEPFR